MKKYTTYKDIEKDLKCSLLIIFNAAKNGIYIKGDLINDYDIGVVDDELIGCNNTYYRKSNHITHVSVCPDIEDLFNGIIDTEYTKGDRAVNFYLKDYGITWALTRKELENDTRTRE